MADTALYVGAAGNIGQLSAGGPLEELVPHVSVVEVGRSEAEASDYWQPLGSKGKAPKPKTTTRRRRKAPVPSESAGVDEAAGSPSEDAATVSA
jgi:hypothetical protein